MGGVTEGEKYSSIHSRIHYEGEQRETQTGENLTSPFCESKFLSERKWRETKDKKRKNETRKKEKKNRKDERQKVQKERKKRENEGMKETN